VKIPVLGSIPADDDIRRKSANYQIIGSPGTRWGPLFEGLSQQVAEAPPVRPEPLTSDGLLGLFKSQDTGRNYVLEPATVEDLCGKTVLETKSLEVIYDAV
jgi:chlorophyllide a reductase subunit X